MAGGEALYERYKDALKRGHVASLRGRLDEALDAYAEASSIAPERPTPHSSAGTALLRRRRPADALRYYEAALSLAPRDEASLLGRAQALAALDRRADAADAFDALAEQRAAGGKLADAVDAARRGLELAEGRDRRRTLERLIARLRASEPGEPGRVALERALLVLEPPSARPEPSPPVGSTPDAGAPAAEADTEPEPDAQPEPGAQPAPGREPVVQVAEPLVQAAAPDAAPVPPDEPEATAAERPPEAVEEAPVPGALDRDLPPDADADALARLAEAALDAGDDASAVERLLDVAAASRARGHAAAAADACYLALSLQPDHVGLHLALVQLYDDAGWGALAAEKLALLDRLVSLGDDADDVARVTAAMGGRR